MIITKEQIQSMEKLKKVQLITSLPGAKPICLVGTQSIDQSSNLAPFSSITHLGSSPPLIGMITRPNTVERHTLKNIIDTQCWTLSHVSAEIRNQAHQCSAKYPATQSEFTATGLNEQYYPNFSAPAVAEAAIKYGLILEDIVDIEVNDTKLVIGRVEFIDLAPELHQSDGGIDLIGASTIASTALDTYFKLSDKTTLPYARP